MPTILGLEGSANKVAVGIVRDGEVSLGSGRLPCYCFRDFY